MFNVGLEHTLLQRKADDICICSAPENIVAVQQQMAGFFPRKADFIIIYVGMIKIQDH